tara:strand:+ start:283 stop:852 length:570 start_codon:yes stop_codon:yes gene_type:complete
MTLASSGTISIGGTTAGRSINLELGRAATATTDLANVEVRALAQVPFSTISMSDFYGKSNALDSINVTVGYRAAVNTYYAGPWYGYSDGSSGFGSITPTSVAWRANATYSELNAQNPQVYSGNYYMRVSINSTTYSNSGWTTVTVSGVTYSRTNFTYATTSGRSWWSLMLGTTSPYGVTIGATKTVVFN